HYRSSRRCRLRFPSPFRPCRRRLSRRPCPSRRSNRQPAADPGGLAASFAPAPGSARVMALRHANDPALDRAFTRLCRRDLPCVYQYALAVLHDRDAAQEVTEATFRNGRYAVDRGERVDLSRKWLIGI